MHEIQGSSIAMHPDPTPQDDALARSKMQQTDKKCQERHLLGYMGGRQKFKFYGLSRPLPILMPKF